MTYSVSTPRDLDEILEEYRDFPADFESLLMATCNTIGLPEASYAPYLEQAGDYYIYISELSKHTGNLLSNPRCSVLFIENEQDAKHLFARRRVTLQCDALEIERDTDDFKRLMASFVQRFGQFMDMMSRLSDFHLFRLRPQRGSYVAGFAQAYEVTGEHLDSIRWRTDKGHQSSSKTPLSAATEPSA